MYFFIYIYKTTEDEIPVFNFSLCEKNKKPNNNYKLINIKNSMKIYKVRKEWKKSKGKKKGKKR